ncbi:hypothetical protein [Clostridium sp.]|uniref:hypothetical protein n=1 Tax=Clostridium sp. TaxID=1506 RepID=UPI00260492EE|nr:hypothetical protein [Clostridium sp.]
MEYSTLLALMTIVFSFIMLFTIVSTLREKNYNFLFENIAVYVFYLVFLAIQYILKFQVAAFIIFMVLLTIIGDSLIGKHLNFYNRSKYYDRFLHALGSFSFSLFFYSILSKVTTYIIFPKLYGCIFVAAIGISLGCIFEIYEFISDTANKINNQHGLIDTNFDLISDVVGAVIAGIVSRLIFF